MTVVSPELERAVNEAMGGRPEPEPDRKPQNPGWLCDILTSGRRCHRKGRFTRRAVCLDPGCYRVLRLKLCWHHLRELRKLQIAHGRCSSRPKGIIAPYRGDAR